MHLPFSSGPRCLLGPAIVLTVLVAGGAGIVLDAAQRRARHDLFQPERRAVVRLLGTADLALSSASRWLRHPSLSEPGAAFADGPAILDADPAGAMIAPPRDLLAGTLGLAGARPPSWRKAFRAHAPTDEARPAPRPTAPHPSSSP